MAVDIANGNYEGAIVSGLMVQGDYMLVNVAENSMKFLPGRYARVMGKFKSIAKRKRFFGKLASAFNIYSLFSDGASFLETGDSSDLASFIGDATFALVDLGKILLRGSAALNLFGPLGSIAAALVFSGTELYKAQKVTRELSERLYLNWKERLFQDTFVILTGDADSEMKNLETQKIHNSELVHRNAEFMKSYPNMNRYIFPAYETVVGVGTGRSENITMNMANMHEITWNSDKPDVNDTHVQLSCFTSNSFTDLAGNRFIDKIENFISKVTHKIERYLSSETSQTRHVCEGAIGLSKTRQSSEGYAVI